MKGKIIPLLAVLMFTSIIAAGSATEPEKARLLPGIYAELKTNKGAIVMRLDFQKTPMTVANFVGLAEGTIANQALPSGKPYFEGSVFHRVVSGHVIQAGRPGGSNQEGPGYEIPNEIHPALRHGRAGMLGMANGGPHTGGSQFYITLAERAYLDGDYTVFGEVVSGMAVVEKIVQGDVIESVKIMRLGKAAEAFRIDDASFRKLVEETRIQVEKKEAAKKAKDAALIRQKWPRAKTEQPGMQYMVLREGAGEAPAAGMAIQARYTGHLLDGRPFSSLEDGRPGAGDTAQDFSCVLGSKTLIPGIERALGQMKKGEKRLLILAPEFAYGKNGFYGKSKPGEKRFVISPNTMLVILLERLEP